MKFSVCLIVKNEGPTLPRLLDSLSDFRIKGGEVCVLDTGSTDHTVQIAKNHGCVVEEIGDKYSKTISAKHADELNNRFIIGGEEPFVKEGDRYFVFSQARNHAAQLASNDMILSIDADEVAIIDVDSVNFAVSILPSNENTITRFEHMHVFTHDHLGNPDIEFLQSKFYDRRFVHWENNVHEMLKGEGGRLRLPRETLTVDHWQNPASDRSIYIRGLAVDCYVHPHKDRQCHYFARELFQANRMKSAEKEFLRHLSMKLPPQEYPTTPTHLDSLIYLGNIYGLWGRRGDEIECYRKAQELDPTNRRPVERMAMMYMWTSEIKKAQEWARKAREFPWDEKYGASKLHFYDIIDNILKYDS